MRTKYEITLADVFPFLTICAFIFSAIFFLSTISGAEFFTTGKAVAGNFGIVILLLMVRYFHRTDPWKLIFYFLIFAWPFWWGVLDSMIANRMVMQHGLIRVNFDNNPWWDRKFFKWSMEVFFVFALCCQYYRMRSALKTLLMHEN
jgi:hypothetical protein